MDFPPPVDIDTTLSPKVRRFRESADSTLPTVPSSPPIYRELSLFPLGPKSIQDSAASSSVDPTAKSSEVDAKKQRHALKACQEQCQFLQEQIRDVSLSIERADEHEKGLHVETNLSANGLTKCLVKKAKIEMKLPKLKKKGEDLTELFANLQSVEKTQEEEITDLGKQYEALQIESERLSSKIQNADNEVKVLDEVNRNLRTMMEQSNRLLPIKKRDTLSGDKSKHSTGTSSQGY